MSVTRALLVLFLALATSSAALAAVPAPDAAGPYPVGHTEATIIDSSRADRALPLHLWYPADTPSWDAELDFTFFSLFLTIGITSTAAKDDVAVAAEQFPLIVFSHGFGGIPTQSRLLMEHLASHGFVVVAISHTGNVQGDMSSADPEADRYPDVAFTIDELGVMNNDSGSPFFGRVDNQNSGVAGHSYGGMTAEFMAAGHDGNPADSRVKAIMPVAASSSTLTDAELQGITIPTLLMVGTLDGLQSETIRAFGLISSSPDLFRVDVVGANHTHFANICEIGNTLINAGILKTSWAAIGAGALIAPYESTCEPPAFSIDEATRIQNLYAAAHFRAYLYGETEYFQYLLPEYAAASEPDVAFFGTGLVYVPDTDGDGVDDATDNCVYAHNAGQEDTGGVASPADPSGLIPDGIGDACQCGDVTDDGKVTGVDGTIINRWAVGLPPGMTAPEKCIVIGPACNGVDATVIVRTVLGLPPGIQQLCAAALP